MKHLSYIVAALAISCSPKQESQEGIPFYPVEYSMIRLDCSLITYGSRIFYNDVEVIFGE